MRAASTILVAVSLVALVLGAGFLVNGPNGTDSGDLYIVLGVVFLTISLVAGWFGVTFARRATRG